jgi:hypothetical protein
MNWAFNDLKVLPILISLMMVNCDYSYEVVPLTLDGTYSGTTVEGEPIVLTLESTEDGLRGYGALDQNEIVFVEGGAKTITGSLTLPDGEVLSVTIASSVGDHISMQLGDETLSLEPGATVAALVEGPFSGYYETRELESLLEALSLTHSGDIITGTAIVLGQQVLVSGWLLGPDSLHGRIILPDETEMEIRARLNGESDLIVTGWGEPVVFQRR